MASALRTILIVSALAIPLVAQTIPEDPPPAIIEGSVINIQNSRTIPRATVTLLHFKGTGSKSSRADGSGHFIFKNVEPGIYRLMAERQGFFSDERKREYQPLFEVAAGDHVRNMPVRLMPAAAVRGEILDEYNDAVQDVEIRLMVSQTRLGQMYLRVAAKATTDDRGEYRIAGLHPGKYYAVVEYKPKALTTLAAIVDNVNALQQMTDNHGHPIKVEMPRVPDPAYTYPTLFYPSTSDFQQAQSLKLNPGDEVAVNFLLVSAPVVSIRGRVTNGMTGQPPKARRYPPFGQSIWKAMASRRSFPQKTARLKSAALHRVFTRCGPALLKTTNPMPASRPWKLAIKERRTCRLRLSRILLRPATSQLRATLRSPGES